MAKSNVSLSKASPYEQKFGTRYRGSGRPVREDDDPLFPADGADRLLVRTAARRAFAVVHEEQRARLREVYRQELAVLKRRGVEQVKKDLGLTLVQSNLTDDEEVA